MIDVTDRIKLLFLERDLGEDSLPFAGWVLRTWLVITILVVLAAAVVYAVGSGP